MRLLKNRVIWIEAGYSPKWDGPCFSISIWRFDQETRRPDGGYRWALDFEVRRPSWSQEWRRNLWLGSRRLV